MNVRDELIERGDLDELTRFVDRLTELSEWSELIWVRDDCRAAAARGKQLWPVTAYVNYVLALRAPGAYAAEAIDDAENKGAAAARFGFGPLPEVAAASHKWEELREFLDPSPATSLFAHECVIHGANLTGEDLVSGMSLLDIPLVLGIWEPAYEVATYKLDKAEFPAPAMPPSKEWRTVSVNGADFAADDDTTEGRAALLELAAHWTSESNGRVDATGVEGSVEGALRALGLTEARVVEISPADAFAHMGWAGASGGAHGRRRGAATGRFAAWWTAAALVDLTHDWPLTSDELEVASKEMKWYLWDEGHDPVGWSLRLGVEDPEAHMAWALRATDEA